MVLRLQLVVGVGHDVEFLLSGRTVSCELLGLIQVDCGGRGVVHAALVLRRCDWP